MSEVKNRYTLDGVEYSPDMELARESCPSCGDTHMVSYRVVEVTEENEDGSFVWRTPANADKLRIIMTSAADYSGRGEVAHRSGPRRTEAVPARVVLPPPTSPAEQPTQIRRLRGGVWATAQEQEATSYIQLQYSDTPYNAPIGEQNEARPVDDVPAGDDAVYSRRMDSTVRAFSQHLRGPSI